MQKNDVKGRIRGTIRAPIGGNNVDNDLEKNNSSCFILLLSTKPLIDKIQTQEDDLERKVNFQELSNPIIWRRLFQQFNFPILNFLLKWVGRFVQI